MDIIDLFIILFIIIFIIHYFALRYKKRTLESKNSDLINANNTLNETLIHNSSTAYLKIENLQNEIVNLNSQLIQLKKMQFSLGEQILARNIVSLFDESILTGCVVYDQFQFRINGSSRKVDFLVISPKGVFVIESKYWKGTTQIYYNHPEDPFQGTLFETFGKRRNDKFRVFNINETNSETDVNRSLTLSSYTNAITQARSYSLDLCKILNLSSVRNIVIFHTDKGCEVFYNNKALNHEKIDYTDIMIDDFNVLKNFFSNLPSVRSPLDVKSFKKFIQENNDLKASAIFEDSSYDTTFKSKYIE